MHSLAQMVLCRIGENFVFELYVVGMLASYGVISGLSILVIRIGYTDCTRMRI